MENLKNKELNNEKINKISNINKNDYLSKVKRHISLYKVNYDNIMKKEKYKDNEFYMKSSKNFCSSEKLNLKKLNIDKNENINKELNDNHKLLESNTLKNNSIIAFISKSKSDNNNHSLIRRPLSNIIRSLNINSSPILNIKSNNDNNNFIEKTKIETNENNNDNEYRDIYRLNNQIINDDFFRFKNNKEQINNNINLYEDNEINESLIEELKLQSGY
jgi:hypothetical protein